MHFPLFFNNDGIVVVFLTNYRSKPIPSSKIHVKVRLIRSLLLYDIDSMLLCFIHLLFKHFIVMKIFWFKISTRLFEVLVIKTRQSPSVKFYSVQYPRSLEAFTFTNKNQLGWKLIKLKRVCVKDGPVVEWN